MFFFFFNDTATTEIYTLSLHDALPIWRLFPWDLESTGRPLLPVCLPGALSSRQAVCLHPHPQRPPSRMLASLDRKSTRLNSSHANISYAVFCLKKKNIFPFTFLIIYII